MKHPFTAEDFATLQQNLQPKQAKQTGATVATLKYPFSNEGFILLQQTLYYLNDAALAATTTAIRQDFKQWLAETFELRDSQQQFLFSIDERSAQRFGQETAFAIENRLPILLKKEPKSHKDEQGKIIWDVSTLSAQSGSKGFQASGMLCFHIAYPSA